MSDAAERPGGTRSARPTLAVVILVAAGVLLGVSRCASQQRNDRGRPR
jgi:hypothetical protein